MSDSWKKFFEIDEEVNSFKFPKSKGFRTKAIHVGQEPGQWSSKSVVPPIHVSATYAMEDQKNYKYYYLRHGSPTRDVLQKCFASLDDAKHCFVFPAGIAATNTLINLMGPGDHIIVSKHVYGGTFMLANNVFAKKGIEVDIIDMLDMSLLSKTLKPNTRLVFFETPTNPCLRIIDIQVVTNLVHSYKKDILVAVDNTFLTPYFQRPLALGANLSMYSISKFINGHTDIVMGALTFNDDHLYQDIRTMQETIGSVPSPYDCHMVQRSLRTLAVRMENHFRNSIIVAKFLESHPAVEKVHHPALKSHPDRDMALKQMAGHSGVVTFWLKNATLDDNEQVLKELKLICVQGSLGGVESHISTPMILSAGGQPKEENEVIGVTDNLVRISVGIEDPEDLIEDLNQALNTLL